MMKEMFEVPRVKFQIGNSNYEDLLEKITH